MKTFIVIGAGMLSLAHVAPAAAQPREYNRGYYDCLAGRYDEEAQSHAYREGCRAAQREREAGEEDGGGGPPDMSEPDRYPHHGDQEMEEPHWRRRHEPPPVAAPAGVPDVAGMQPPQVLATMASRGYRNVGTSVAGAAIYGIYFNPVTGECVQVANISGRAVGAVPSSDSRCR
jgi:hypothetical protein